VEEAGEDFDEWRAIPLRIEMDFDEDGAGDSHQDESNDHVSIHPSNQFIRSGSSLCGFEGFEFSNSSFGSHSFFGRTRNQKDAKKFDEDDVESPSMMGGQNETSPAAEDDVESPLMMGGQNETSPPAKGVGFAEDCHTKVPAWPTHLSAPNIAPLQLGDTGVVLQDYEDQAVFHGDNESKSSKQQGQETQPSLIDGVIASGAREGVISSGAHVATSTRGRGHPPSRVGRTSNKTGRGRGRPRGGGRARDASSSAVDSSNVNSNATGEEHNEGTATTAPTRGSTVAPTQGRGSSRGRGRGRSSGR